VATFRVFVATFRISERHVSISFAVVSSYFLNRKL
jgi:hypothetical protein